LRRTIYKLLAAVAALAAIALANPGSPGLFRDVTRAWGIRFELKSDMMRLKLIPSMNGGCAFGDYDGDGRPDLYVVNSVPRWGKKNEDNCGRLYRNVGGGRFEDVTQRAGIHACGLGMGAFWVDLDGDGLLDLYLTNVGPNAVYWNRGDGTFEEGKETGLEDPLFSVGAAFLDYDGDGRVDVAVANYLDTTPEWESKQPLFQLRVPEDYVGQPSHLFHNDGQRHFTDATRAAGLSMDPRDTKTLSIAVLDYDGDGHPDLYFVNDRVSNRLFHNRGDGTFEEVTAETGAGVLGDHPRAGMGVAVGDPFGEGRPSLVVTNFGAEPNSFYRNVEGQLFEDGGKTSGVSDAGLAYVRWGTDFADFDNDGWPDLYFAGGHLASRMIRMFGHYKSTGAKYVEAGDRSFAQRIVLLHNTGKGGFEEWKDSGDLGAARLSARGTAVADIDGDGNLDLFVTNVSGGARLFKNLGVPANGWIEIEPRVGPDRRTVLGTRVTVSAGGHSISQTFAVSASYASGSLTSLHFGLGAAPAAERVEIVWPGGLVQTFRDVPGRRGYTIQQGQDPVPRSPSGTPP
jgi:enediyne biosynthesis protein E4